MTEPKLLAPDSRPTADAGAVPPPPMPPEIGAASSGRSWLWPLLRIVFIAAAGIAAWYIADNWDRWTGAALRQRTDDAFVVDDLTPLSAKVSDYIATVAMQDFATVRRGDVLAEIEPSDCRAQLAQAEANRATAEATLINLSNQKTVQRALVRQAEATIEANAADVTRAHLEANRQRPLLVGRLAGTPQAVEQSDSNETRSAAELALSKAALDQQNALLDSLDVQEKQLTAQRDAAAAQVQLAANNLGYTQIRSPVDGMVGQRQVRPGQFVNIGTQIVAVMPLPNIRSIVPIEALTIGGLLQLSRLFGGEIGTAFMQTFVRVREQLHSNMIGQHIAGGTVLTADRLAAYVGHLNAHLADGGQVGGQSTRLLAADVASQANVLAYQDAFIAAACGTVLCLMLVALIWPGRPSSF